LPPRLLAAHAENNLDRREGRRQVLQDSAIAVRQRIDANFQGHFGDGRMQPSFPGNFVKPGCRFARLLADRKDMPQSPAARGLPVADR